MNHLTISPKVEEGIRTLNAVVNGIQVVDGITATVAGSLVKEIGTLSDGVEAQRLEFTKPLNESLKNINIFFKKFSIPLNDLDQMVRGKLIEFKSQDQTEQNIYGDIHFVSRLEIEVEDALLIPKEYLVPDMAKIKKLVQAGVKIPGIKVINIKGVSL